MAGRTGWLAALLIAGACFGLGCNKSDDPVAAQFAAAGAIVQEHDNAKVAWTVDRDGNVQVAVRSANGKPVTKDLSGELLWEDGEGKEQSTKLELNRRTGLLEAKRVDLPDNAVTLRYALGVRGEPVKGKLQLPVRSARTVQPVEARSQVNSPTSDPTTQNTNEESNNAWEPIGGADTPSSEPTVKAASEGAAAWGSKDTETKAADDPPSEGWGDKKAADDPPSEGWGDKKAADDPPSEGWSDKKAADDPPSEGWGDKKAADQPKTKPPIKFLPRTTKAAEDKTSW